MSVAKKLNYNEVLDKTFLLGHFNDFYYLFKIELQQQKGYFMRAPLDTAITGLKL